MRSKLESRRRKTRSRTPLVDRVATILKSKNKKLESLRKQKKQRASENEMKECTF